MNDIAEEPIPVATEIDVVEAKEAWSEYRLADGTLLRIKPVMIAISRTAGQTPDGDPIYDMRSTLVTDVRAPQQRKRAG